MKTRLVFAILALSCFEVTFSGNAVNDVSDKATYEKKERDKSDFHRYEDWGMDWSDADMMQHPIDEGPRRVSFNAGDFSEFRFFRIQIFQDSDFSNSCISLVKTL